MKNISKNVNRVKYKHEMFCPRRPPKELLKRYTLDGKIDYQERYIDNTNLSKKALIYTPNTVDKFLQRIKNREKNYYGQTDIWLYETLKNYPIQNKTIAVMGSMTPWYEAICLAFKGKPFTIEYNRIICQDHRLNVVTVEEYLRKPFQCDAALSISSFEHDGLGRYEDPIDSDGDSKTMRRMKNIIKPLGLLFLAVPIGKDTLVWNAHRIYGPLHTL